MVTRPRVSSRCANRWRSNVTFTDVDGGCYSFRYLFPLFFHTIGMVQIKCLAVVWMEENTYSGRRRCGTCLCSDIPLPLVCRGDSELTKFDERIQRDLRKPRRQAKNVTVEGRFKGRHDLDCSMLGPRRPHTSAGASDRTRARERESDRDNDDYTQPMFWTTSASARSKAGSTTGGV